MNNDFIKQQSLIYDVVLTGLSKRKIGTYQLINEFGDPTHSLEHAMYIVLNTKEDFILKTVIGCKFDDDDVHTDVYTTTHHINQVKNCVCIKHAVQLIFTSDFSI